MKPKPILFNTAMVRALLDGRKSVTRRVVKPQPEFAPMKTFGRSYRISDKVVVNEPHRPGDILYVRETFRIDYLSNVPGSGRAHYKADGTYADFHFAPERYEMMRRAQLKPGWRPNENMPKEIARLFLRVTSVRVERLQDSFIAQGDTITALRDEGIDIGDHCRQCIENYGSPCCNDLDPDLEVNDDGEDENGGSECGMLDAVRCSFFRLWDSTIEKADIPLYGWAANPWVWVIEFERVSGEEAFASERNARKFV